MPNSTDCTRYYICDSTSGTLFSYTCPPQMAFNANKHVCETGIYEQCKEQTMARDRLIISQPIEATSLATTPHPTSCYRPGKIRDPESSQHYFICYFQNNRIVRYKMACPNTLHYCASDKVCKKLSDCFD